MNTTLSYEMTLVSVTRHDWQLSSYSSLELAAAFSKDVLDERSSLKKALRNLSSLLSLLSQLLASNSSERPFPRGTAICALECSLPVVVIY